MIWERERDSKESDIAHDYGYEKLQERAYIYRLEFDTKKEKNHGPIYENALVFLQNNDHSDVTESAFTLPRFHTLKLQEFS